MRAAVLLLVACASNFLVSASPTPVLDRPAPAGVRLDPRGEPHHSPEAVGVDQHHQPRELAKRFITSTDRRMLVITINAAVATAMGLANTYSFGFDYHFDFAQNRLNFNHDRMFSMRTDRPPIKANVYSNGCDLAIPLTVVGGAAPVMVVRNFVWGALLRADWTAVVGMGRMVVSAVTSRGTRWLQPDQFQWSFDQLPALPPWA